jgi:S-adenosylmethionine:tRNA ribosyltransferase-isomerase
VNTSDFDFDLPESAIAQEPLRERDAARLLVLERASGRLRHHVFTDLPGLLDTRDLLVVNRSRVLPARLIARRAGGGEAEILLLRKRPDASWEALLRPGRRLREGDELRVEPRLGVRVGAPTNDPAGRRIVHLLCDGDEQALLQELGSTPLPPYIRRPARPDDRSRYQTVYAREPGSVAAPTAGLHFTPGLLHTLAQRGIERAEIVLHVGTGTFRPVSAERVEDHRVDPEPFLVPKETADAVRRARLRGGRVVAVGTTTTRVLETTAAADGTPAAGEGETDLVVVPGYSFRAVDALLTNFHLPRSSLLLLVAAFAGRERVLDAYREALGRGYRFYSYGDAMLIL